MTLAEALAAMEAQPSGVGGLSPLDETAVLRLRQLIQEQGGLRVTLDCRDKVMAISDTELVEVILPLCCWLIGLADAQRTKTKGDLSDRHNTWTTHEHSLCVNVCNNDFYSKCLQCGSTHCLFIKWRSWT